MMRPSKPHLICLYRATPFQFTSLSFRNIPIMNMTYSGALKTAIYGLYLKITGKSFGVISWRLVGILFVSIGILIFSLITKKKLYLFGLLIFYILFTTDVTVLLATRHDWGPVALALFFRLLFIAIWIRGELSQPIPVNSTFWLAFLVGISIFEKLSSAVLIIPLIIIMLFSPERRNSRHILGALLGSFLGILPLIFANTISIYKNGNFISLVYSASNKVYSIRAFFNILTQYLSLGSGELVQNFILGHTQHLSSILELFLLSLTLTLVVVGFIRARFIPKLFKMSGIMLMCYFGIVIGLYLLPHETWVHHWIIGTPFQYAAIGLFISGLKENNLFEGKTIYKYSTIFILGIFCLFRLTDLYSLEKSLIRGDTSVVWDISYTQLAEFAVSKSDNSLFVAEDWGVANQIICFSNGRSDLVYQPDYPSLGGINSTIDYVRKYKPSEIYLIFPIPPFFTDLEKRNQIVNTLEKSLFPDWQVKPVESQVSNLRSIFLVKLEKYQ